MFSDRGDIKNPQKSILFTSIIITKPPRKQSFDNENLNKLMNSSSREFCCDIWQNFINSSISCKVAQKNYAIVPS